MEFNVPVIVCEDIELFKAIFPTPECVPLFVILPAMFSVFPPSANVPLDMFNPARTVKVVADPAIVKLEEVLSIASVLSPVPKEPLTVKVWFAEP